MESQCGHLSIQAASVYYLRTELGVHARPLLDQTVCPGWSILDVLFLTKFISSSNIEAQISPLAPLFTGFYTFDELFLVDSFYLTLQWQVCCQTTDLTLNGQLFEDLFAPCGRHLA